MDSGVNMLCFSASYALALILEFSGLWNRLRLRRFAVLGIASAGMVAHTWFLGQRVAHAPQAPLASHQDWYLLAAWVLALVYLAAKFYHPKSSMGLFLLPAVLALVAGAQAASMTPLATFQAPRLWGRIHGVFLMLGTVAVLLGFLAGLMYLIQSHRLKHKLPTGRGLRLPSLEWLERVNSRALVAATVLVGGGFFTGVISRLAHAGEKNFIPWSDPIVLSLAAMLIWLVVAELFRLVYPAARRGRKVAYLTVAAFVFLLFVLVVMLLQDTLHTLPLVDGVGEVEL
jgi:ABC-type uncharacterized transport system permease subunit